MYNCLENNPEVLNHLAYSLGLPRTLAFHDVYSLHDPDLLALVPRPAYALVVIIPLTQTWNASREAEAAQQEWYNKSGGVQPSSSETSRPPQTTTPSKPNDAGEQVLWFHQTILHGCGSISLLHSVLNHPVADMLPQNTPLHNLLDAAIPLNMADRAQLLEDSDELYTAHQNAAHMGDSRAPTDVDEMDRLGQHFVTFVKGVDGHLWELEGARKGPIDRGELGKDEDLLSKRAIQLGLGRVIEMEKNSGGKDLRFSCVALTPTME